MADILPPAPIDAPFGAYNWVDWYKKVRDAINNAGSVNWASITGKPTTLSGFGITDGQKAIQFKDDGVNAGPLGTVQNIDFVGAGVNAYFTGSTLTVAVPGASTDWTYSKLTGDVTATSTTPTTVLSFTPAANTTYVVECFLLVQSSSTTTGAKPGISWPTGLVDGAAYIQGTNSSTSVVLANINYSSAGSAQGTDYPSTNTSYPAILSATFTTGSSPSGNFSVTIATE